MLLFMSFSILTEIKNENNNLESMSHFVLPSQMVKMSEVSHNASRGCGQNSS